MLSTVEGLLTCIMVREGEGVCGGGPPHMRYDERGRGRGRVCVCVCLCVFVCVKYASVIVVTCIMVGEKVRDCVCVCV